MEAMLSPAVCFTRLSATITPIAHGISFYFSSHLKTTLNYFVNQTLQKSIPVFLLLAFAAAVRKLCMLSTIGSLKGVCIY